MFLYFYLTQRKTRKTLHTLLLKRIISVRKFCFNPFNVFPRFTFLSINLEQHVILLILLKILLLNFGTLLTYKALLGTKLPKNEIYKIEVCNFIAFGA